MNIEEIKKFSDLPLKKFRCSEGNLQQTLKKIEERDEQSYLSIVVEGRFDETQKAFYTKVGEYLRRHHTRKLQYELIFYCCDC